MTGFQGGLSQQCIWEQRQMCARSSVKEKSHPLQQRKKNRYLISLSPLWCSLWNGRCKLLTEQVQHFWACALSLFNLPWKRLLLWGDFCHGNNAEHCSTQHRFKEEQAVSPMAREGGFCFDTGVSALMTCCGYVFLSWAIWFTFLHVHGVVFPRSAQLDVVPDSSDLLSRAWK